MGIIVTHSGNHHWPTTTNFKEFKRIVNIAQVMAISSGENDEYLYPKTL